jgi:hypothetical protein
MWLKNIPPVCLDAGAYWRLVEEHGVNVLFSAPTAFRAMRQADPDGLMTKKYDLSTLRAIFVAGERSDPSTVSDSVWSEYSRTFVIFSLKTSSCHFARQLHWIEGLLRDRNVPVIDHW